MLSPLFKSLLISLSILGPSAHPILADTGLSLLTEGEIVELDALKVSNDGFITILANNPLSRAYGNSFTEKVYNAATETTRKPAGKGLVVIGNKKEIHPILLMKRFMTLAANGELETAEPILCADFQNGLKNFEKAETILAEEMGIDIDPEVLYKMVPVSLKEEWLNLYMIAREERFDEQRIDERFQSLSTSDLKRGRFGEYDWTIYLPRKDAVDEAFDAILPAMMKKAELGFFTRKLIRGALFTFKPMLRDAMEAKRKALLYESILTATSALSEQAIKLYTKAYEDSLMPRGHILPSNKEDRSLEAIEEQRLKLEEYAQDPFLAPEPLPEFSPGDYSRFIGAYGERYPQAVLYEEDASFWLIVKDETPIEIVPASDSLFVSKDANMTIELSVDPESQATSIELRKEFFRETSPRMDWVECYFKGTNRIEKIAPVSASAIKVGMGGGVCIFGDKMTDRLGSKLVARRVFPLVSSASGTSIGKGLLIAGGKDDPHPIEILKAFINSSNNKQLPNELAPLKERFVQVVSDWELRKNDIVQQWGAEIGQLQELFPYRLEPDVLELYLIAKSESENDKHLKQLLQSLNSQDLGNEQYNGFDWAVYIPHKNNFESAYKKSRLGRKRKEEFETQSRFLTHAILLDMMLETTSDMDEPERRSYQKTYKVANSRSKTVERTDRQAIMLEAFKRQREFIKSKIQ